MNKIRSYITNISRSRVEEFIKFAVVGGSGVVINMGLLYFLTRYLSVRLEFASPIAIETSILTNFALNNFWTFKKRDARFSLWSRLLRYHLVTGLAGLVNYLVLLMLVRLLDMNEFLSNLIGIGAGMLINYFLNSLWTWRERSS
ncbi:GtrA family protein [Bacteroidota bacterium]